MRKNLNGRGKQGNSFVISITRKTVQFLERDNHEVQTIGLSGSFRGERREVGSLQMERLEGISGRGSATWVVMCSYQP